MYIITQILIVDDSFLPLANKVSDKTAKEYTPSVYLVNILIVLPVSIFQIILIEKSSLPIANKPSSKTTKD
jgi:hypothetical protein